jgi:hypothetical protein
MPNATAPLDVSTPIKLQKAGPDHSYNRTKRVRVDYCSNGVRCVVEAVDEFESKSHQQRQNQEYAGSQSKVFTE